MAKWAVVGHDSVFANCHAKSDIKSDSYSDIFAIFVEYLISDDISYIVFVFDI
jgi:hypothetical protein